MNIPNTNISERASFTSMTVTSSKGETGSSRAVLYKKIITY
ncbi:hypothetical protein [Paenibacillus sp. HW567]|nr:hypothetical protein [Paenibacillus sp. HW567]